MPQLRRLARSCALAIAALGVTTSGLAAAPAQASDTDTLQHSTAVALSDTQLANYDKTQASRRELAARRFDSRIVSAERTALNQRGDAYAWGAVGPNAFDCSGLIVYSYRQAGFSLPRTSGAQAAYTHRVAKQNMRPGDLMFFSAGGSVYHVAMFIGYQHGRAMMVHSPGSGQRVTVAAAWTSGWFGGTLR